MLILGLVIIVTSVMKWAQLFKIPQAELVEIPRKEFFQNENIDPIGFGLRYRATRLSKKNLWDEWLQMYPNAQFEVNLKLKIMSTGSIE